APGSVLRAARHMTQSHRHPRRGTTLVELLIALVVLAVIASVVTLALRMVPSRSPNDPHEILDDSMRAATASGRAIEISLVIDGRRARAWASPTGAVMADSA